MQDAFSTLRPNASVSLAPGVLDDYPSIAKSGNRRRIWIFCAVASAVVVLIAWFLLQSHLAALERVEAANRRRDSEEAEQRAIQAQVVEIARQANEAERFAFEKRRQEDFTHVKAKVKLGLSFSEINLALKRTPFKTTVLLVGDVLPEFGLIAKERLVFAQWQMPSGVGFDGLISHSDDRLIRAKLYGGPKGTLLLRPKS
jgi:hypothetical protein